jgi:hypothetical protein
VPWSAQQQLVAQARQDAIDAKPAQKVIDVTSIPAPEPSSAERKAEKERKLLESLRATKIR